MHISPQILRLALLRIFAETGDSLSFTEISGHWPRSGLRAADLRDAVRELLDSGDLVGSGEGENLTLALSAAARRGLSEPYGELHMASFDDEATLFVARHRERHGIPYSGRRTTDMAPHEVRS